MSAPSSKPDVSQIALEDLHEKPFAPESDPAIRVSFSSRAYEDVRRHAHENTRVEICGVLIGCPAKDKQGPHLEIRAAIRGEHADAKAGQVTFTHKTWEHVQKVMAAEFPDLKIVGWYHSHPGFGLFLSPQDEFIHGQFFNLPWQVAFVIDPVAEEDGFFVWKRGKPVCMRPYWVGGEKKTPSADFAGLRTRLNGAVEEIRAALPKPRRPGLRLLPFIFGILFLALLSATGLLQARRYFLQLAALQKMTVERNIFLPAPTDDLLGLLKGDAGLEGLEARLFRLGPFVWCEGSVRTHAQKERAARVLRAAPGVQAVDITGLNVTHEYVTVPGDTLSRVALKVYGDARRWWDLFEANKDRVDDPGRLRPDMVLKIPE